ncbi:cold-shock protein [Paenibacillus sp. CC-CFT747]|nr:cold-shock protein [Paenibacillus sp. CC-CFT747]
MPEIIPEEDTNVWACSSPECKGWMRQNFAFQAVPDCPLCGSGMNEESRMLPALTNTTRNMAFS